MSGEGSRDASLEYLDLLAATLTQHEKNLDSLIEKLEKAAAALVKSSRQAKEVAAKDTGDRIVVARLELRPAPRRMVYRAGRE